MMSHVAFGIMYGIMWALTSTTLMFVWARGYYVPRAEYNNEPWGSEAKFWFGLFQGLAWPIFIALYSIWGIGYILHGAGTSFVKLLEAPPKERRIRSLRAAEADDPYMKAAMVEVEQSIDPWKNLDPAPQQVRKRGRKSI